MSIVVNTNMQALQIANNLNGATNAMNTAMKRMSTGYKINSAADDAAGLAVSTSFETTISSSKVATQNAQIGSNLLTTTEGTLEVVKSNLQRIRDLAEQAANGTYSDRSAMETEVKQRSDEIDRISANTSFGNTALFNSTAGNLGATNLALQVGTGTAADNVITVDKSIFKEVTASAIGLVSAGNNVAGQDEIHNNFTSAANAKGFLTKVDAALSEISGRETKIGAFQNRLTSAQNNLTVQQTNLAAANSTIKDADIATESATFVKSQILQSASASLLSQANSAPQIALKLIQG